MAFYNSKFLFEHEYVPIFSIKCQYFPTITNMMQICTISSRGQRVWMLCASHWIQWMGISGPRMALHDTSRRSLQICHTGHNGPPNSLQAYVSNESDIRHLKYVNFARDHKRLWLIWKNRMQLLPCEWVCPPLKKFPPVTVVVSERVAEQLIQRLSPFSNQLWKGKIFQPHLLWKERFSNLSSFGRERFSNLASCGLEDFPTSLALGRK